MSHVGYPGAGPSSFPPSRGGAPLSLMDVYPSHSVATIDPAFKVSSGLHADPAKATGGFPPERATGTRHRRSASAGNRHRSRHRHHSGHHRSHSEQPRASDQPEPASQGTAGKATPESIPTAFLHLARRPSTVSTNGAPLAIQPVISIRDRQGEPMLWSSPVFALVSAYDSPHSTVLSCNNVAAPNDIGLAVFESLAFVGKPGVPHYITFYSPGAAPLRSDLIVVSSGVERQHESEPEPVAPVLETLKLPPVDSETRSTNMRPDVHPGGQRSSVGIIDPPIHRTFSGISAPSRAMSRSRSPTRGEEPDLKGKKASWKGATAAQIFRRKGKVKVNRLGIEVYKGHPRHHIMKAMQEGIILSVKQVTAQPPRALNPARDFGSSMVRRKYKKSSSNRLGGAMLSCLEKALRTTPVWSPGGNVDQSFEFYDFNPMCFRQIREIFGVDSALYIRSLSEVWTTLLTPGKSKALLYFAGARFVIKTVTKPESKFLRSMMCAYFKHCQANPHTLITRFYGHHCLRRHSSQNYIRFVVMNNVFQTENLIHTKYDLKGSSLGRHVTPEQASKGEACIFKDNDLMDRYMYIGAARRTVLMQQLRKDVEFLKRMDTMDYSFLLGIHNTAEQQYTAPPVASTRTLNGSCFTAEEGGMASYTRPEIYYFGVIDFLQEYCLRKRLEHFFLSIVYDGSEVSAVPPDEYGDRFLDFMSLHVV